jgi:hypothetical protein
MCQVQALALDLEKVTLMSYTLGKFAIDLERLSAFLTDEMTQKDVLVEVDGERYRASYVKLGGEGNIIIEAGPTGDTNEVREQTGGASAPLAGSASAQVRATDRGTTAGGRESKARTGAGRTRGAEAMSDCDVTFSINRWPYARRCREQAVAIAVNPDREAGREEMKVCIKHKEEAIAAGLKIRELDSDARKV